MRIMVIVLMCIAASLQAGNGDYHGKQIPHLKPSIEFVKNKGQWKENIQFQSQLPAGKLFVEGNKLVYLFYDEVDLRRIHELSHSRSEFKEEDMLIDAHLFTATFPGSNEGVKFEGRKKKSNYNNYFLGNDPHYWAGDVPIYNEALARNMWDGIDYRLYSSDIDLKYDFIVQPGAKASDVKISFSHLDNISLKHGNLYLKTSVNELIDLKPVAFQQNGAFIDYVECNYTLVDGTVSFEFPKGYDKSRVLVIDPQLVFSSYTGATQDNWGFTATFDLGGNLYGGGIAFTAAGFTYPTTTGAFQINQGGGGIDMAISKFSSDGTSLVYSTYLGGSANEIPHSLVVNHSNQLVVLGTTSSVNFPVTTNAFDTTYNITGTASILIASRTFVGSDIVLTLFSAGGNSLVGSTYVGGTSFDGANYNNLEYNYGDDVRGEVVVDNSNAIYVASTTASTNFPVTNGSFHQGSAQDAVVFKMSATLTSMVWSTYLGGSGNDAAYSVQISGTGDVYVAGGTASPNFPTTSQTIHPTPLGGLDGFLTCFGSSGPNITASTRLGTSSYDQAYFVQIDDSGNVYATGQTTGPYTVTPGTVYSVPNSSQFIHKLNPTLDTTIFSTVIGNGGPISNITVDISPSAFLVNQCNHIYLAGWGGNINANNSSAVASTTNGLPVTPGAHKTTTDGNDFYLIVLGENADSLLYATFFGGASSTSGEHVDGGTSRFDKKGIVYQAVCAGCGGSNTFPTTPNAWSTTNGSGNCNLGVIKFDLSQLSSQIGLSALTKVCIPGSVTFKNQSNGGTSFFWSFGDGNTSTQFQPTHTYLDTGIFNVMLVIADSLSCIVFDTTYMTIKGESPPVASTDTVPILCPGSSVQLMAYGGSQYQWSPSGTLSNNTIQNPIASPTSNTSYMVVVSDSCGSDTNNLLAHDTAYVFVVLASDLTSISPDDTVCKGEPINLFASGGQSYDWIPPTYLNKPNVSSPIAVPLQDIVYTIEITDQYGCLWTRTLTLHVEDSLNPGILSQGDTTICIGDTASIFSSGGRTYSWTPANLTSDSIADTVLVWPSSSTAFTVEVTSKCFRITDTILVVVNNFITEAMSDTFACEDVPIRLFASPGKKFIWEPKNKLDSGNTGYPRFRITETTSFEVEATDTMGCKDIDSVIVELKDPPFLSAGNDQFINQPGTRLEADGVGDFLWEPAKYLFCADCPHTDVDMPIGSVMFMVTMTDKYGCQSTDDVLITRLENNLFVPNSFTPNSDQINDVFLPYGYDLDDYKLRIFNRWGQIVYVSLNLEIGWDGTYKDDLCENGVYIWEISYFQNGAELLKRGTVSLVR